MAWNGNNYEFVLKYAQILPKAILDTVTGNFTQFLHIIKGTLTETLLCKGSPTDPATGTFFYEVIDGYFKVWLHDENGTNSLVYITDEPIVNTNKSIVITVRWNYDTKELRIYKNAVPEPITIDTSEAEYHASPDDMGLLNVTEGSGIETKATGKNPFTGTWLPGNLLYDRALSSSEIYTIYQAIKVDSPDLDLGDILFTSTRHGSSNLQLYTIKEDGTDPNRVINNGNIYHYPIYNSDKSRIAFINSSSSVLVTSDLDAGNPINIVSSLNFPASWTPDNNKIAYCLDSDIKILNATSGDTISTILSGQTYNTTYLPKGVAWHPTSPRTFLSWGVSEISQVNTRVIKTVLSTDYGSSASSTGTILSQANNGSADTYMDIKYNHDGSLVGLSFRPDTSTPYQVCTITDAGGSFTPRTAYDTDTRFCSFSPDGTQLLFTRLIDSKWQLWVSDLDGSNDYPISNNEFNDRYGDWKAAT